MTRHAVGIGARPGAPARAVRDLLDRVAAEHGLDLTDAVFATVATRAGEPGLRDALRLRAPGAVASGPVVSGAALDAAAPRSVVSDAAAPRSVVPGAGASGSATSRLVAWPADELAEERVPHPDGRVAAAVGTPSVAEAAALRTARTLPGATGAELVVPKTVGDGVTIAVAVAR